MTSSEERFGEGFGAEGMWGLKELPYPDAVAYLPQTWGWLAIALLAVGGVVWALALLRSRRLRHAYRQEALERLEGAAAEAARALPSVLRHSALCAWPREEVAGLRGADWIDWLNRTAGQPLFEPDDAERLDRLAYLPVEDGAQLPESDVDRLLAAGRSWLRTHRAGL